MAGSHQEIIVVEQDNRPDAGRNLRAVAGKTLLNGMASSMMRAVTQPFVLSLGAPMSALGFLESLGGMHGLLPSTLQYYSGWLSDRMGRKPFLLLANGCGVLGIILLIVAALTGNWLWLVPGVALAWATLMGDPVDRSVVAESSPISGRGAAYSLLMTAHAAPGIFAPALGGWLALRWGFVPVFGLEALLYAAGLLLVLRFLRETARRAGAGISWQDIRTATKRFVVPPRDLRGYYWTMAVDSFVWGLTLSLLFGTLTQTHGLSTFQLGIMSSLMALGWTLTQWPVGKLIDRFGSKPVMIASQLSGIPIVLSLAFSSSFPAFAATYACVGVMAATWLPAQMAILANSTPEGGVGEAMGRLAAFQGLVGFPAPFVAGLLYERFGFQAPLLAGLVGILVTVALLALLVKEPEHRIP